MISDVGDEIKIDSHQKHFNNIHIRNVWNYLAYAIENILYLSGFIDGKSNQWRQIQFEHQIKDISGTENICLVLLTTGIAYKLNSETFQPIEINSLILQRPTISETKIDNTIFGISNESKDNKINNMIDEFITHIASGRSFSIVITNKNNVYNLPLKIFTFPSHVKIKKISCGNEHCLILTTNGDLYAFGSSS